jgi:hypothetical protein
MKTNFTAKCNSAEDMRTIAAEYTTMVEHRPEVEDDVSPYNDTKIDLLRSVTAVFFLFFSSSDAHSFCVPKVT